MAKKPVSTSLDEQIFQRVTRVAKVDRRSIAQVIEICVERALVQLEEEISDLLKEKSAPSKSSKPATKS
jgi:hypothetical protein